MTTAICPGHNYQSKTANAAMPNYCEYCKVWWGLGVATGAVAWFDGPVADLGRRRPHISPSMLPSEDDDGSATEIARLREDAVMHIGEQAACLVTANRAADTARTSLAAALAALDDAATLLASEGYEEQANALRAQGGIHVIGTAGPSPLAAALAERDALAVRVRAMEPVVEAAVVTRDATSANRDQTKGPSQFSALWDLHVAVDAYRTGATVPATEARASNDLQRIKTELANLGERLEGTFLGGYSDPRDIKIFRHGMGTAATCVEAVLRGEQNQAPDVRAGLQVEGEGKETP